VSPHFLLTNDDGIDAPGLAVLADRLEQVGRVTVIAPHEHLSGCSHRVTTDPLRVEPRETTWHAVEGTPGDCVRLGLLHLAADADWVISGVNDGANLGVDVFMSGTVAAAREAALMGRRAIALSQYRRRETTIDWPRTVEAAMEVIASLTQKDLAPPAFWNVNLPDPLPADPRQPVHCPLDPNPLPVAYQQVDGAYHYRGVYRDRRRHPGTDVERCFAGEVTITRVEYC